MNVKRVWAFYVLFPLMALIMLLTVGFSGRTAAAPGVESGSTQAEIKFVAFPNSPDPNETLRLVNLERVRQGIPELRADKKLGNLAAVRAADMASRQYYAHKNPDGKYYFDYFGEHGISAGYNCENLDLVFVPNQEMVIKEWMASLKGHRGCMLNTNVTHAGYSATKLTMINFDGSETVAYLVVAVHAEIE